LTPIFVDGDACRVREEAREVYQRFRARTALTLNSAVSILRRLT
jgi:uncharacterized protein YaiI (UPF0178 family)